MAWGCNVMWDTTYGVPSVDLMTTSQVGDDDELIYRDLTYGVVLGEILIESHTA